MIFSAIPALMWNRLNRVRPRRPEQCSIRVVTMLLVKVVSIESGLEGRNNQQRAPGVRGPNLEVSIESGLEGRNNVEWIARVGDWLVVSIESGLEGRNNRSSITTDVPQPVRLNRVRPRRPEQW